MYEENFDHNMEFCSEHIGMEHVDEHDECVNCKCSRPSILDEKGFEKAVEKYHRDMDEYNRKNWFVKLFTKKPKKPILSNFISY